MNSEQIREILEAATPGDWLTDVADFGMSNTGGSYVAVFEEYAGTLAHVLCRDMVGRGGYRPFEANAKLFAASKYLAAEVLRLREQAAFRDEADALMAHTRNAELDALRAELAAKDDKIERLGREVNTARYGRPDFAWSVHKAAMNELRDETDALRAEVERLKGKLWMIRHADEHVPAYELKEYARAALGDSQP
jgi:cell division protein FtsB